MSITVLPIVNNKINTTFSSKESVNKKKKTENNDKNPFDVNPISRKGEVLDMIKTTFIGGLVVSGYLFLQLADDISEPIEAAYKLIAKKQKDKNLLIKIGGTISLFAAALCGGALLYTLYNAPKIAYQSKVNTFKKEKEMDVYIKSNASEKELYEQLTTEAKKTNNLLEKENLKSQYTQLSLAPSKVPDFVKNKTVQTANK